ncbi:MAG: hypothetical protein AAGD28_28730 [Bacteroidota bacterium]
MKKYKKTLHEGFKKRNFELVQINRDSEDLPWWVEEKWIIRNEANKRLIVNFLTDRMRENGNKRVEAIALSTSEMKSYQDTDQVLLSLDMRKGNFDEKLEVFWKKFEKLLTK